MNPTYQHVECIQCGYHMVSGQTFEDGADGKPVVVKIKMCPRCGLEERL